MSRITSEIEFYKSYPTSIQVPLAWGEMDSFQHINNIYYFRYFESARMHYLGLIGALDYLIQNKMGPILASTDCKFIFPLKYPGEILVGAKIESDHMQADRFVMDYAVWSKTENKLAALGSSLVVYYDYNKLTKVPIPEAIRRAIAEHRGRLSAPL